MTVDVVLKCGKMLEFEDIDNFNVQNGVLRLKQGNDNPIMFNWDEVVYVSIPDCLDVSEYKSTLGGGKC